MANENNKRMTDEDFKTALDELDISQADFGRITEYTTVSVSNWVTGKSPVPKWVPLVLKLLSILSPEERKRLAAHERKQLAA